MATKNVIAATLHAHECVHDWHGYTQGSGRNGDGEGVCVVNIDGVDYAIAQGDRDCSSSVIDCWVQALKGTVYEGCLDGATYTGNMRAVFVESGLFEWHPMGDGYIAQTGDIYLNEVKHTAMCQSAVPDMLSEFSINENGKITGGQVGDQTGKESHIRGYYNFPWDGILAYNGKADSAAEKRHLVCIQANHDSPYQRWRRIEREDGLVGWRNMGSGRMIDIPDNSPRVQTVLQTYPLPDSGIPNAAQVFEEKSSTHGGITESRYYVRDGVSWDIQDGSYSDGALLHLYNSNDGEYPQRFLPVDLGDGVFIIVNFGSYKVLTEFDV